MQFAELTEAQLTAVYQTRLTADFPPAERKPLARILAAREKGDYRCTGLFSDGQLLAYGFFMILRADTGTDLLLDDFAVDTALRGQGIGSAFLRMLPEQFPDAGIVLIESETPETAENPADREKRERRIRFYQRAGCIDCGAEATVFGVRYRIFELPLHRTVTAEQLRAIYAAMYRKMLPPALFASQIRLEPQQDTKGADISRFS